MDVLGELLAHCLGLDQCIGIDQVRELALELLECLGDDLVDALLDSLLQR